MARPLLYLWRRRRRIRWTRPRNENNYVSPNHCVDSRQWTSLIHYSVRRQARCVLFLGRSCCVTFVRWIWQQQTAFGLQMGISCYFLFCIFHGTCAMSHRSINFRMLCILVRGLKVNCSSIKILKRRPSRETIGTVVIHWGSSGESPAGWLTYILTPDCKV